MASQVEYLRLAERKLSINLARGFPGSEQLDLSNACSSIHWRATSWLKMAPTVVTTWGSKVCRSASIVCPLLGLPAEQTVVSGNSSLALMHDCLAFAMRNGFPESSVPWQQNFKVWLLFVQYLATIGISPCASHLCPDDPVPLLEDGPDMDAVRKLVSEDSTSVVCGACLNTAILPALFTAT
ncbi:hypothetical protein IMF27_29325, partial [Pseudomonas sp. PCH199]